MCNLQVSSASNPGQTNIVTSPIDMDSEGTVIRKSLAAHHLSQWGFVIYRCTYGDDAAWANFLHILNTNTRRSLEANADGDMWDSLAWVVVEDPAGGLDGADTREVRRRFREWVAQSGIARGLVAQTSYCVSVDAAALQSISAGPQPPARDLHAKTWVNLIDIQWEPANGGEEVDEGEQEVDGCREFDVGWMRVGAGSLAPRAYAVLEQVGWEGCYKRPPKVVKV